MRYVYLEETVYPIDTDEQMDAALAAMRAAGIDELPVMYTPAEYDWVIESGDPDGYELTGIKLFV